ncbi:MAG: N-6 DNA methylase, partial [Candidatus Cloacimonetes bacterium]|nr:N-6 DNA methylase [Candidatus Cloacimonadota bacterium]
VTDMNAVMGELGDKDPIIHFYECFLSEYNPTLRKNRGVYYTPNEVVNFIVRAVDDILINDFELPMGLASVEPISDWQKNNINIQSEIVCSATDKHRVQILDPATGTGTFLVETIKHIHHKFSSQQGLWQSYVSDHLLPRLNGFEILMAPYTMAHLNLNWTLEKTGFINENEKRLRVFLTNSLDEFSEGHRGQDRLFSQEADEAGAIKLDTPVMVVLGNPPYNVESQTSNEWIDRLLQDYKKEPTGEKLNEKNPKSINDDYVKFIRFGQHFIEKKGEGVLAFITNNSFLDNPTFRGMRWNLLNSFNKVYIIDLHGSSIKKEIAPDSSKDENVFNIMQGVSINIFVKKSNKDILVDEKKHAEIYHYDLYGKREDKFTFLQSNKLYNVPFKKLRPVEPYYFFTSKVFSGKSRYEKGFSIQDMFLINSVGVSTARDDFTIHFTAFSLTQTIKDFVKLDIESARNKYRLGKDTRDWSVAGAHKELTSNPDFTKLVEICYRPFDKRFTYYTGKSKGFHCTPRGEVMRHFVNSETIRSEKEFVDYIGKSRGFHSRPRNEVMRHFLNGPNVGLVTERIIANKETPYSDVFIINKITDKHILGSAAYVFPLYLKPEKENEFAQPNMNMAIVQKIAKSIELPTVNTKQFFSYTISDENNELTPINIFDYIYARLHSQSYREKYKEFLKIDFPKIPYPENADEFWHYVSAGRRLRKLHLMDGVEPDNQIANFNVSGTNVIDKPKYINIDDAIGKVYINDTQHFDNVPLVAWEFYIGGYQPAQKWLKDRKGKTLSYDDIIHYQKIVKVLYATYGEMKKIDYQNLTQNIFPKLI